MNTPRESTRSRAMREEVTQRLIGFGFTAEQAEELVAFARRRGYESKIARLQEKWTVLLCPLCGATSINGGRSWSAAGVCHLGNDGVTPVEYAPVGHHSDVIERAAARLVKNYSEDGPIGTEAEIDEAIGGALLILGEVTSLDREADGA